MPCRVEGRNTEYIPIRECQTLHESLIETEFNNASKETTRGQSYKLALQIIYLL